jgi:heat shock protein HtpX
MQINTVKTFVLLAGIAGLLVTAGTYLAGTGGAVVGLLLGLAIVGASYWASDRLAVRAANASEVSPGDAPELHATVADLAARAGLPKPRVFLSPSPQPNAFATGRDEHHAVVAVTQGLLDVCDRDELRGVLAHEMAHIRHRDVLIGSVAAALATGISFIANIAMFMPFLQSDDDDAPNPFALLLLAMVAPIAATLLQLAISRGREFEADRLGARLAGGPEPLARALEKLDAYAQRVPMEVAPAQASHFIVNPLRGCGTSRSSGPSFARLFSTHPSTEERVARLRALAPAPVPA